MHAPVRELRFGAFTLDLLRCVVRRGNEELPLRPQSFDVLRYLVERPGRIVSKEELFAAIWPGVTVTDDSLVQCIRDIRQALGDSSRQIVKAVPKRGYLLQPPLPKTPLAPRRRRQADRRRSCCRKRSLSVFWGPASSARGTGCRVLSRPAC